MVSKTQKLSPKASLPFKVSNKHKRQDLHVKRKKAKENIRRDERFRRRREEDKNPGQREERLRRNIPSTLDRKRVFDEVDRDVEDGLGVSIDAEKLERIKRQRIEEEENAVDEVDNTSVMDNDAEDRDSMLSSTDDSDNDEETNTGTAKSPMKPVKRDASPTQSTTSTNLDLNPTALAARFPTLFPPSDLTSRPIIPKVLITTSINSTLYEQAKLLTTVFPNSVFVPRSNHRYGHKFSIKEIASFATNRHYTSLIVLMEDAKRPSGLNIVHLPSGPSFHFSISTWVAGKKLPGHGNPTDHVSLWNDHHIRKYLSLLIDPRAHAQQLPHTPGPSHRTPLPLAISPTARHRRPTSDSDTQPARLHLSAKNAVRLPRKEGDREERGRAGWENRQGRRGHSDRIAGVGAEDHVQVEAGGCWDTGGEGGGLEMEGWR